MLEFLDQSHLTIGANSAILIDDFVFDPSKVEGNALINLSVGTLRFVTGQMPHGGVVIRTPTATLTLRGTDVSVRVHPNGTTDTVVHEGEVDVHNDATGGSTSLITGQNTTTTAGGNQSFNGDFDPNSSNSGDGSFGNVVEQRRAGPGSQSEASPGDNPKSSLSDNSSDSSGNNDDSDSEGPSSEHPPHPHGCY